MLLFILMTLVVTVVCFQAYLSYWYIYFCDPSNRGNRQSIESFYEINLLNLVL